MVKRLGKMRKDGRLQDFTLAMKRVVNILPRDLRRPVTREEGDSALRALAEGKGRIFDEGLMSEPSERNLADIASRAAAELEALAPEEADLSVEILAGLVPAVNSYFDDVLVNCEDESVRNNRISFLTALSRVCGRYCNFMEIVSEQSE
jgi:glycyl-tRNA synthetase beta subunit